MYNSISNILKKSYLIDMALSLSVWHFMIHKGGEEEIHQLLVTF